MPRLISTLLLIFLLAGSSVALAAGKQRRALPYQNGAANGWQAVVSDYGHAPSFLIAVDKQDQQVSLFERKSPLTKIAEYTCTTGQNEGDKLIEGDMKTPEGVYFVVKHINSGLNYGLYGHEAYPLNYPNPVDRLRNKTGYGIWIHGKGIPLVPFDSNGCVGMFNNDLATLRKKPMIGQPVTLAVDIAYNSEADPNTAATAEALAAKVEAWARAWSDRSAALFDFYEADSYSLAQGQSFSHFRSQKERLFKALPWINTTVSDIQVLEGPGYWVTWFNQDYKAPNLRSSGTRRLYWQQDQSGELRIVGMEWLNGLKSPVLYAENKAAASLSDAAPAKPAPPSAAQQALEAMLATEGRDFIKSWQEAWREQDATAYAKFYSAEAVQGKRKGIQNILKQKIGTWAKSEITRLDLSKISIDSTERGLRIVMRQDYADSLGYTDRGVKVLYLEYEDAWRIVREDWKPLARQ